MKVDKGEYPMGWSRMRPAHKQPLRVGLYSSLSTPAASAKSRPLFGSWFPHLKNVKVGIVLSKFPSTSNTLFQTVLTGEIWFIQSSINKVARLCLFSSFRGIYMANVLVQMRCCDQRQTIWHEKVRQVHT